VSPAWRKLVLLLTLAVFYVGPVVACVCPDSTAHTMPCCPEQPACPGHGDALPTHMDAGCDAAPAILLVPSTYDLPAPVAIANASEPAWRAQGPPPPPILSRYSVRLDAPPIYLTTLRLRN
jgi:hypothetical protein